MEQIQRREKKFKWNKKMKTFHLTSTCMLWWWLWQKYKNYTNIKTSHSFSCTFSSKFLSFDSCLFIFCFYVNWKTEKYLAVFISTFRSRHWKLFCKTALQQDIMKIVIFFTKLELVSSKVYLLTKKFYKFIKSKTLHRHISGAMVKRSILQLYRRTFFLVQLWMAASNYLFDKCDQKTRQVNNQIIRH